ncbi:hypothetical protein LINPERPRIM_LOCUS6701 [Linum perenne]
MLSHSKVATIDNLQRRGFHMVNRYVLCYKNSESINHFLLHRDFSVGVWNRATSKLSIHDPLGNCIKDVFLAWKGMHCSPFSNHPMRFLLHTFYWSFWLEHNNRIFNDKKSLAHQVY